MENSKKMGFNISQLGYLVMVAGILVVFLSNLFQGNWNNLLYAVVPLLLAVVLFPMVSSQKIQGAQSSFKSAQSGLQGMFEKVDLLSLLTKIDVIVLWGYLGIKVYSLLNLSKFVGSIPILGKILTSVISGLSSVLFYFFLLSLLGLIAKGNFKGVAFFSGLFSVIALVNIFISLITSWFNKYNSFSSFSSFIAIMIFWYIFSIFSPHYFNKE